MGGRVACPSVGSGLTTRWLSWGGSVEISAEGVCRFATVLWLHSTKSAALVVTRASSRRPLATCFGDWQFVSSNRQWSAGIVCDDGRGQKLPGQDEDVWISVQKEMWIYATRSWRDRSVRAHSQSDVTQPSARPQVNMARRMGIDVASGALLRRQVGRRGNPTSSQLTGRVFAWLRSPIA